MITAAQLSPDEMRRAINRIQRRIDDLEAFDPGTVKRRWAPEVNVLGKSIEETLQKVFGPNTLEFQRYSSASRLDNGPIRMGEEMPLHSVQEQLAEGKSSAIALLSQAIRGLEEELDEIGDPRPAFGGRKVRPAPAAGDGIFIVHGHEDGMREATARFLEKLGFRPIILHEQANAGRTIIEKVEVHSDVRFAVVLLSPDDLGRARGDADLSPRARQNVVLELGYFLGKLGRSNVCALMMGNLEFPSDFAGVVYTPYDSAGAWKAALAKELDAAKFPIDWNKVMRV